jgi:hypothetical protein
MYVNFLLIFYFLYTFKCVQLLFNFPSSYRHFSLGFCTFSTLLSLPPLRFHSVDVIGIEPTLQHWH